MQNLVQIPSSADITSLQGEGDLYTAWKGEKYSGSFSLKLDYPDKFLLEVYGPFGQTVMHVKKDGNDFLFIAGDEKTTDERAFEDRYGLRVRELMDDLTMRGLKHETADGLVRDREGYRVLYTQDKRNRKKTCLMGDDGTICLTFHQISFTGS
jgi:hypothetical protein